MLSWKAYETVVLPGSGTRLGKWEAGSITVS